MEARSETTKVVPRVSVVMPVHDAEAFLEQAVESVLAQTLRDLELVAVDDGSIDGSARILESAARRDDRVRIIRRDRGGVVAALNDGCAAARANYIARLDADDIALPTRLQRQVALLDAHPDVGLVGGGYVVINAHGVRRGRVRYPVSDRELRARLHRYNTFAHPAVTFRRLAFEEAGGYRIAEVEDYDLWLRISERWRLAAVREPVLGYRHHRAQVSVANHAEQARATLVVRTAAERRRAGEPDPLEGVSCVTPELAERLGIAQPTVERAALDHRLRWAAMLTEAGDAAAASALLKGVSSAARRELQSRLAFARAKEAARAGRLPRALRLLAVALVTHPMPVVDEFRLALARRAPGS